MTTVIAGTDPLALNPQERTAFFIDGSNLYAAGKALGFAIDYRKLLAHLHASTRVVRVYYYTSVLESEEYSSIRPLLDWLDYNGYAVVTKPAKEFTDSLGRRKVKGNMDIELVVDMLELAPHVDHVYLFSGDGDYRRVVEAVQRVGKRVTVISTLTTQPPMVADELRRQADSFVDLAKCQSIIARDDAPQAPRPQPVVSPQYEGEATVTRTAPAVVRRREMVRP